MIYEDPDSLGYWIGPDAEAPASTMEKLTASLPVEDQETILLAAFCAHEGKQLAAERVRREADYDNIGFRPDADTAIPNDQRRSSHAGNQ